jgi:uncharacterized protein YabE (DUF348 family)
MEFIARNKIKIIAFILIALLAVFTGFTTFANAKKDVDISVDTNNGNNQSVETKTVSGKKQTTVRELLESQGYTIDEDNYTYNVDLDAKVRDISEVTITKKVSGNIEVDGKTIAFKSNAATVGEVLTENGVTLGSEDIATPGVDTALTSQVSNIKVVRVVTKQETRTEAIDYAVEQVENADILKGTTEISTYGEKGVQTITEKVVYKDGNETSRDVVSSVVTQEPVNQVLQVGTKVNTTTQDVVTETSIPYTSTTRENADLAKGTQNIVTAGVNGVTKTTERVTYENGVEASRTVIDVTTTDPVNEVIEVGTKEEAAAVTTPETPAQPAQDTTTVTTPDTSSTDTTSSDTSSSSSDSSVSSGNSTESVSDSDFDLICAIVAHEGGTSYDGALAVISCVMNRADSGAWGGSDALSVLTAPGQFASYLDGYYTQYLGADIPEVRQAVRDCLYSGVRSHPYTSFRSYETSGSVNICGNWYF